MVKLGLLSALSALVVTIGIASFSGGVREADAADACQRTKFETEMVAKACKDGGQAKAKDVMKAWNKEKNVKSCNQCHDKLAPTYSLKKDGLKQYKDLGGK